MKMKSQRPHNHTDIKFKFGKVPDPLKALRATLLRPPSLSCSLLNTKVHVSPKTNGCETDHNAIRLSSYV